MRALVASSPAHKLRSFMGQTMARMHMRAKQITRKMRTANRLTSQSVGIVHPKLEVLSGCLRRFGGLWESAMRLGGWWRRVGHEARAERHLGDGYRGVAAPASDAAARRFRWSGRAGLVVVVGVLLACTGVVAVGVSSSLNGAEGCGSGVRSRVKGEHLDARVPGCASNTRDRQTVVAMDARERWLNSGAVRAQRVASRVAFHGLSSGAALQLAQKNFGSRISGYDPAALVGNAGKLVRYVGSNRALVKVSNRRMKVITSTAPLRVSDGGVMRPVNLGLRRQGDRFAAITPLQRVSISRDLKRGVSVGGGGLRVSAVGADVSGRLADSGKGVFFADAGLDEDFVAAPTIDGVELSAVLRSRLSPQRVEFRFALPSGAALEERGDGAVVMRDGDVLAKIPAPSAVDAQGSSVPVRMGVTGDELVADVEHRSREIAYPLYVDPRIVTYAVTPQTPGWHYFCYSGCPHDPETAGLEGPEPAVISSPGGARYGPGEIKEWTPAQQDFEEKQAADPSLYSYEPVYGESPEYRPSASWEWNWPKSPNRGAVQETTYYGVKVTPFVPSSSNLNGSNYKGGTGAWGYSVGCYHSSTYAEAPPAKITGCKSTPIISLGLLSAPSQEVWWGPPGPTEEVGSGKGFSIRIAETSAGTTLSVDAVVIVEEVQLHRRRGRRKSEMYGPYNEGEPNLTYPCEADPVNCATGNFTETQADLHVPGRGVGLTLARTYNAQAAVSAAKRETSGPGLFGYGWSWTFGARLMDYGGSAGGRQIVEQANGSTVVFNGSTERARTEPGVQATLVKNSTGDALWTYTLPDQNVLRFDGSGALLSETDRNGNVTSVAETCASTAGQGEEGCRVVVTDPDGRKLRLYKNSEGLVERAVDPMGNTVKYAYENGALMSVTEPGETSPRWRFHYDSLHRMTEMINGRDGTTTNEYDSEGRVIKQTSPRGDTHRFEYRERGGEELEGALDAASETSEEEEFLPELSEEEEEILLEGARVIPGILPVYVPPEYITQTTDENIGAVKVELFDSEYELSSITEGDGTPDVRTRSFTYDSQGNTVTEKNGRGKTTHYGYDLEGNKTSETDPLGDKRQWKYDSRHDVIEVITPRGGVSTITRDADGNALAVARQINESEVQITKYAYNSFGELTGMTNPLGGAWKYEYDGAGDRIAEVDPAGDKRTFTYDGDSREASTTSPRGNVPGGQPTRYTTTIERDAQGRVIRVTEPLE